MAKLNTYFPDPTEATPATERLIFGKYAAKYSTEATWLTDFSANTLDIDYLFSRSGEKWASPFLEKLSAISEDPQRDLPNYWLAERIADVLHNRYTEQWNRLHAAMFADYDPIENYSMIETTTHGHVVTDGGTDSITYGRKSTDSGQDQITHGHTINTESRADAVQEDRVNGFNTTAPATPTASVGMSASGGTDTFTTSDNRGVPSTASLGGNKGSGTETHSGSDSTTYGKATTLSGSDSTSFGKTETHSGQDSLTRSGNIGVTTSQQMIESEILLRERNRFLEVVYNNVDELLALSIY